MKPSLLTLVGKNEQSSMIPRDLQWQYSVG